MFITIEDLYEMKESYQKEVDTLILKMAVVDDLIKVAELKKESETETVSYDEVEVVAEATETVENYDLGV